MARCRGFRFALRIIQLVSLVVPRAARAEWRREWEAELWHAAHVDRAQTDARHARANVVTRALGAIPDAAWIRRQFTLDADAVHDAAHAARMLFKTPAFTGIALLVFVIGIGTATAIVSMADALLLRPMPVPQPERIMTVWQLNRETGLDHQDVAPGNALDWIARAASFESAAIAEPWTLNTTLPNRDPEYLTAARVSEHFFTVLGTTMFLGRPFVAAEFQRGAGRVVILSYTMERSVRQRSRHRRPSGFTR
jgi:hypothetical protein